MPTILNARLEYHKGIIITPYHVRDQATCFCRSDSTFHKKSKCIAVVRCLQVRVLVFHFDNESRSSEEFLTHMKFTCPSKTYVGVFIDRNIWVKLDFLWLIMVKKHNDAQSHPMVLTKHVNHCHVDFFVQSLSWIWWTPFCQGRQLMCVEDIISDVWKTKKYCLLGCHKKKEEEKHTREVSRLRNGGRPKSVGKKYK